MRMKYMYVTIDLKFGCCTMLSSLYGYDGVIYDETYGIIYEVFKRKFGASKEPFWYLKISKYVENLSVIFSDKYHIG